MPIFKAGVTCSKADHFGAFPAFSFRGCNQPEFQPISWLYLRAFDSLQFEHCHTLEPLGCLTGS